MTVNEANKRVNEAKKLKVAVLGASGGVGRFVVRRALDRGHEVACETRDAKKLDEVADRVHVSAFDPMDAIKLKEFVSGADVVVFSLGVDTIGATTLFSDVTRILISAMSSEQVSRLIAVTGFLYDWIIYPLFTRKRYVDKGRQEALIAASGLDWIIVRPAPFSNCQVPGAIAVHTTISPGTVLRRITRDEVAAFVVDQFESDAYLRQRPVIGHP